jgi:protein-tyrosine-phosphatase/DNA-binding HxlR family transcriptional regulator|nr:helix-turn-helix domain-containing protein [Herbiconiux sp.]
MNIELQTEVVRRAAKHAALGDPARLQLVDLLTLGDLAPSEIGAALGVRSNLITHHLKVLEAVGIITRTPSEADKRRSYVHLVDGSLEDITPGAALAAQRVVFVCSANSARSQLASALWANVSNVPSASGGTHPAERIDPGALAVAARHDLRLTETHPRNLVDVVTDRDFVITVCDNAHEQLGVTGNLHWSIPDPVRIGTDAAFDTTVTELKRRISSLAPRLVAS